jgi:hypothetical protein
MDLEFGQIFGSYRRDFVPLEAGILVGDADGNLMDIECSQFDFDGNLVMRKNSVDSLGNPIGIEEKVINPSKNSTSTFDPWYRISRNERKEISKLAGKTFESLRRFSEKVLSDHDISELVFFGAQEDMNLLKRSGLRFSSIGIKDLQRDLRQEIGHDLSLDKASLIIGYGCEEAQVYSNHFSYEIPDEFHNQLIPHKAVGDIARIFLLHREMEDHKESLISSARSLLQRIESYRESDEEVPIF